MAESQILGLFASPRSVEDAVRQQIRQTAPQFESAPNQRLFNAIAEAGAAFDPRVQKAREQQEIAKNVTGEFGTAKYYYDLAEQFRQRGMLQSAVVAADKAKSIEEELMDKATAKYGSISFVQYGSQATNIRRLIMQIERTTDPASKRMLQKELEEAFKKGAAEVAEREAQEMGMSEAAKLKEQRRNESMKAVQAQFEKANANDQTVFTLKNGILRNLENINTGFGSSVLTGFQAFARAIGITESDDRWSQLSANTQAAQSVIGQLMLEQIKTLGTNPSNADREFLMKTLPDMSNEPGAIKKIAAFMEAKAIFLREDARAKLKHLETNSDLVNYETPKAIYDKLEKFYEEAGVIASRDPMTNDELFEAPAPTAVPEPAQVQPQPEPEPQVVPTPEQPAPEQPAPAATQSVIPEGLRTPAGTSEGITQQINEIQALLQGSSDLDAQDRSELAGLISRLGNARRELQQQETQNLNVALDAIVTSGFPTTIGAEQRLANMTRKQKLEYAYRVLTLKMNSGREMSQVEMKVLQQIINELQAGL